MKSIFWIMHTIPKYRSMLIKKLDNYNNNHYIFCPKIFYSDLYGIVKTDTLNFQFNETNIRYIRPFYFTKNLLKILKKNPHIIIFNGNLKNLDIYFFLIFKLFSKKFNCKFVWLGQLEGRYRGNIGKLIFYLRTKMMKFFDGLILYTNKEYSEFKKISISKNLKKITYINNGADCVNTFHKFKRKIYLRKSLKKNLNFLFMGRISQKVYFDRIWIFLDIIIKKYLDFSVTLNIVCPNYEKIKIPSKFIKMTKVFKENLYDENKYISLASSNIMVYPGKIGLSAVDAYSANLPLIVLNKNDEKNYPEIEIFNNKDSQKFIKILDISEISFENNLNSFLNFVISSYNEFNSIKTIHDWDIDSSSKRIKSIIKSLI